MKLTRNFLRTVPKVLLHDHLDGGVRPQTVIDLARDQKYTKIADNGCRRTRCLVSAGRATRKPPPLPRRIRAYLRRDANGRSA